MEINNVFFLLSIFGCICIGYRIFTSILFSLLRICQYRKEENGFYYKAFKIQLLVMAFMICLAIYFSIIFD